MLHELDRLRMMQEGGVCGDGGGCRRCFIRCWIGWRFGTLGRGRRIGRGNLGGDVTGEEDDDDYHDMYAAPYQDVYSAPVVVTEDMVQQVCICVYMLVCVYIYTYIQTDTCVYTPT
jgi:hypothetical protein